MHQAHVHSDKLMQRTNFEVCYFDRDVSVTPWQLSLLCVLERQLAVEFAAHAADMGCLCRKAGSLVVTI